MTADETHPMTKFLRETGAGNVAYSPSTEIDTGRHWIFNWEKVGFNFNFVVHDRDGVLGKEIYAKDIEWVGRFLSPRKVQYVEEPREEVNELVSESVETREEPLDIEEIKTYCASCDERYEICVMPRIDLVIEGAPAQRVFEETCPECGEELIEKRTYTAGDRPEYSENASELDETALWKHSRRSV